jgi:hypothetical protein
MFNNQENLAKALEFVCITCRGINPSASDWMPWLALAKLILLPSE